MRTPAYLAALFLSLFLTACGGGDPVAGAGTDGSTDDATDNTDNIDDADAGDVTTSSNIDSPSIGNGVGESFSEGVLNIDTKSLSAGGSTQITATIVDAGNSNKQIVSQEYTVLFSSPCASDGKAEFSKDSVTTSSGSVTVTYKAKGCSGSDFVTFTLTNAGTPLDLASGSITIAPAEVGSLTYVDVSAPAISISTIGNNVLPKTSTVTFRVADRSDNPIANKTVDFSLTKSVGGVSLALDSSVTDENGEVQAIVLSGTSHTTVSVVAVTLGTDGITEIPTSSLPISITTGIPDQDSFDISASVFNPGAYDVNQVEVEITAAVGDQFQNPVADGTIVNFTAESGLIDSFCLTEAGTCTVTWKSSGYRPGEENDSEFDDLNRVNESNVKAGTSAFGITTILAYTEGEGGYTDSNNNGVYDDGEAFEAFPEAIRDDDVLNFTLTNDTTDLDTDVNGPVEFFADYNANGLRDAAPSVYQGALCSDAAKGLGHCGSLMNVRDLIVISQSDSNQILSYLFERSGDTFTSFSGSLDLDNNGIPDDSGAFWVFVTDINGAMPAAGTSLSVSGDGYDIGGNSGAVDNSVGLLPTSYVGLPSSFGQLYQVNFTPDGTPKKIVLTFSSPGGSPSKLSLYP